MYLIIPFNGNPFITNYYNYENHFCHTKIKMIVNYATLNFTVDGKTWLQIEIDHL